MKLPWNRSCYVYKFKDLIKDDIVKVSPDLVHPWFVSLYETRVEIFQF